MRRKPARPALTPNAQLLAAIGKFPGREQKLFRAVRAALRRRLPTANELAYQYSHSVVVGYSPTHHGIQAVVALALRADGVALYFNQGPRLPDPKGLLQGKRKQTRFIAVETASQLRHPDVEALIAAAITHAPVPLPSSGRGSLVIQSAGSKSKPARRSRG